jgi:predicted Rossmann fold nucleotide-binding protein DprA/Smf involved in DNA uptake
VLTTTLARTPGGSAPLGPVGWARLWAALEAASIEPGDLLSMPVPNLDGSIEVERIVELLRRAAPASMEIERLSDVGIWAMAQTDPDYPSRLGERLARGAPPVLFGAGERALLDAGGLAVVGSRDSSESALEAAGSAGRQAAEGGTVLISGAARGIDQAAMDGALRSSGKVIGVVADHLDRRIRDKGLRDPIAAGQLVLITPYVPSAGFSVRTAMGRNKVIYALADAALVMSSAVGKGGTWEGAIEAIKVGQPSVFVWQGAPKAGRDALLAAGASSWPSNAESRPITIDEIRSWPTARSPEPQLGLFENSGAPTDSSDDDSLHRQLAQLHTLDMVRLFLERIAEDVPDPSPALEPATAYLALLGRRASGLYANVHFSLSSPTAIAPILAIRPLVELVILTRWIALDAEAHGFLYMADSEAVELAHLRRITEHAARRGSKVPATEGAEEAVKAAIKEEGFRRLRESGVDYGKGRLVPRVERMVEDVIKADPSHEIAMRDAYVYAYRTFSPWEHSSGSSFKTTAAKDGESWRWIGDLSPFHPEDIEAIAASMYAYLLESILSSIKPEAAALAREVRDYVTVRWVRSELIANAANE